ncbi:hypothetical protein R3P38DRAFT_3326837 [Favolaschia claudopus]|uniref:Uncharacterized protein n=1 Tax=Favolaschia claudopus TaxID=2862362 RepID=A0AAW0A7C9_9AGAR
MHLTDAQRAAVAAAKKLLDEVGLTDNNSSHDDDFQDVYQRISSSVASQPSPAVLGYRYKAPPAREFTLAEVALGINSINRQTSVHRIVEHPLGAIVEYPETGASFGTAVAHVFAVDPTSEFHPKLNIQYSLGDNHGGRPYVKCGLILSGRDGEPVSCNNLKIACKGLKVCSARGLSDNSAASATTRTHINAPAAKEIFDKTLAFFCAIRTSGCAFDPDDDGVEFDSQLEVSSDSESDSDDSVSVAIPKRARSKDPTCRAKLVMGSDEYGRPLIQCEKRSERNKAHLVLRNLDEFNIPYLRSLLSDDSVAISEHEISAKALGYGPLIPCSFTAPPSAQKDLCPYWHRDTAGKLARGVLQRWKHNCLSTFNIYTPYDLVDCPYILIICQNPHSHPRPSPVKTPPPLLDIFQSLLQDLDWKLADATPRKIVVESGFISGLRRQLGWNQRVDPPLSELHPSLGNLDHVRRYIDRLRKVLYPDGTGLEGKRSCAVLLMKEHLKLPKAQQYVRCAETHTLDDGKIFHLIICMFPAMSEHLMQTRMLSLDTAFKRIHGKWEEFELETWDIRSMHSVVDNRAFTTSQSAQAHFILFTRIFEIAALDTGVPVRFRHIHGDGMEMWIADAHKGEGLGAGMFCQSLCRDSDEFCPSEPNRRLRDLSPVDHLRRFYRICTVHYKRNINDLRPHTTSTVRKAMLSLASCHEHPDINGALKIIENGGKKAKAWLKDKITGTKFALPALYQPMSLIPLEIWKAAPATTNGNEQAHRNVNRDGVNLTILGGIMRGMQYDARAMAAISLYSSQGIYSRDQTSTHFRRTQRSVARRVLVQHRIIEREEGQDVTDAVGDTSQAQSSQISARAGGAANIISEQPLYTTRPLAPAVETTPAAEAPVFAAFYSLEPEPNIPSWHASYQPHDLGYSAYPGYDCPTSFLDPMSDSSALPLDPNWALPADSAPFESLHVPALPFAQTRNWDGSEYHYPLQSVDTNLQW